VNTALIVPGTAHSIASQRCHLASLTGLLTAMPGLPFYSSVIFISHQILRNVIPWLHKHSPPQLLIVKKETPEVSSDQGTNITVASFSC